MHTEKKQNTWCTDHHRWINNLYMTSIPLSCSYCESQLPCIRHIVNKYLQVPPFSLHHARHYGYSQEWPHGVCILAGKSHWKQAIEVGQVLLKENFSLPFSPPLSYYYHLWQASVCHSLSPGITTWSSGEFRILLFGQVKASSSSPGF